MSNNPRITKKELLIELARLQRENAHLKTMLKLNSYHFEMQKSRIDFFKKMTCLSPLEQACLVPMANFLNRLAKCPVLEVEGKP